MAWPPGKQLNPAVWHLWAVIFKGDSGFIELSSKDGFWFERQNCISCGLRDCRKSLVSIFPVSSSSAALFLILTIPVTSLIGTKAHERERKLVS